MAVGSKVNYLCYHTRRSTTPWFHNVENATAKAVQASLDNYNIDKPIWGAGRTIHNALLFCSTVHQFAGLFGKRNKFSRPFDSISIIPVNNSGAAQLNALLKTSPLEYEHLIIRYLLKSNERFQEKEHPIFKLTYDGVPVFFGYSMDLNKIMDAYSEYLDKTKFYIVCYAEQVKYYKAIMPEIKFL